MTDERPRSGETGAGDPPRRGPAVAVMARRAVAGAVKRRLAATIGDGEALRVYRRLLDDTLDRIEAIEGVARVVAVAEDRVAPRRHADRSSAAQGIERQGWTTVLQRGDTLGERLGGVFDELFADGHEVVAIVGSDSPALPRRYVREALDRAAAGELIFGPAADGGYYLVACGRAVWLADPAALAGALAAPPAGTATTLEQTTAAARAAGARIRLLPLWVDVDEAADLPLMERLLDPAGDDLRGLPLGGVREVYLHVTNRCGGGCTHCYNLSSPHDGDELDTGSWRSVIDECVELGAGSFVILGGDPFLRDDLFELIEHMTGTHEARVRVFFNREIDSGTAASLAAAGRGRLRPLVSVDGSREVNDGLRGAGNFDGVLRSLAALREAGLEPLVNSVALRPVLASLPEALPILADAGVRRLHLILPHQRGGLDRHLDMVPSGSELLVAVRGLDVACSAAGVVLDNLVSWRRRAHGRQDFCTAGCRDIAVDPFGKVHACAITCGDPAFVAGDLRRESLAGVWRDSPSLRLLRAARARDREECAICPVVDACGGECWVQAHYAARARGRAAGYGARFPYCELVRPVFEEIAATAHELGGGGAPRAGEPGSGARDGCGASGACGGQAAAGAADFALFDCI